MLIVDYRLRCGSRPQHHRRCPDPHSSEAGSLSSILDSLTVIWLMVLHQITVDRLPR